MLALFGLVFALAPQAAGLALGGCVILLALAVVDALSVAGLPVPVTIESGRIARFTKQTPGELELHLRHQLTTPTHLQIGLPLPECFEIASNPAPVQLDPATDSLLLKIGCTPHRKGEYRLDAVHVGQPSPLGLWTRHHRIAVDTTCRVYPDLSREQRRLAAWFLRRDMSGMATCRLVGQGRDFERLRDYQPGDHYSDIHWKTTAKRGRPVTKLHQAERTQEVLIAIDTSRLSGRHLNGESALEHQLASALLLGRIAQRQGDQFGVVAFSDKVDAFVRPGMGTMHYNACRDAIYTLESRKVNPSYEQLFSFLRVQLRRRAMVIVLTDLSDALLAEQFNEASALVSRHHLLTVGMLQDPRTGPLYSAPIERTDDAYVALAGHLAWQTINEQARQLGENGIWFELAPPGEIACRLANRYMQIKQRQLL